jgi:hypothetical protein
MLDQWCDMEVGIVLVRDLGVEHRLLVSIIHGGLLSAASSERISSSAKEGPRELRGD